MRLSSPIQGASFDAGSADRHAAAAAVASDGWLIGRLERCFEMVAIAWRTSAARMRLAAVFGDPQIGPAQRVRLVGCAVLSAATVHILLVGFDDLLKGAMAGLGWIIAVPLALVCIGLPGATVRALESSRVLRGRRSRVP